MISRGGESKSTSNLHKHARTFHSQQLREFRANKYEENTNSISEESTSRPTSRTVPQKRKFSPATENTQVTLTQFIDREKHFASSHSRAEALTKAIAKMSCMDNQTFSVVENQGFVSMMSVAEQKYKLPTRKHLSKTDVPIEMYEKVKVRIENILEPVQYVSITNDMWSSTANDDYLSITAQFLDDNYKMQHVCLEVISFSHEMHSAENTAAFFKELLGKWGLLEKLSYVVRDNARNMSAAMEKAGFKDVSCLTHTLQLVSKDMGHFKHSVKANKQLKAAQETLHMPQECMIQDEPTRWNSTLHMLKRVVEQRRPLVLCLSWPGLNKWDSPHPSQWSLIEAITEILSLFENATLAISYQNVNVGETIPIINSITTSLKENCTLKAVNLTSAMPLQQYPHFKTKVFVSNEAVIAAKQHILSEMDKLETSKISALSGEIESSNEANFTVNNNNSTNFNSNQKHAMWSMYAKLFGNASSVHQHMVKSEDELPTYLNEPILSSDGDVPAYWENARFQRLKKLTKCYLAIPPANCSL
ncbi:hypothetical protein PR048_001074 [Dryococelus australis]|uniref:Uncharacterized protein n=1 Tax=Dryococelus australis TaxID=614101 RepID=A0ABQ9IGF5_9NEOP|nr:hypothetical protein PR048_001074 [Dryococelus australis]